MEAEELCWCPSCSNSLWQGWSFGLVHCPGGNATDPIWRVLASSDGISFWTPLKLQHSIPCWLSLQWEPSECRSCQCYQKKGSSKVCGWICSVWPSWVWESQHASTGNSVSVLLHIVLPHVQIAFLKFTSCDNQSLVGCIAIPAVAVPLNLKS